jgi:hypothetical protein
LFFASIVKSLANPQPCEMAVQILIEPDPARVLMVS